MQLQIKGLMKVTHTTQLQKTTL